MTRADRSDWPTRERLRRPADVVVLDVGQKPAPAAGIPIVVAVGDIHGMAALLEQMLRQIEQEADLLRRPATVVFLGDVVNRGPDTRGVIERLSAGPARGGDRWVVLRGNHEEAMRLALSSGSPAAFDTWLRKGGVASLRSYGLSRRDMTPARAVDAVGPAHLAFLSGLPLWHREDGLVFVHAGVKPKVPLEEQDPRTLLTTRGRFLTQPHGHSFKVVHGHTPTRGLPELTPWRINVDTGAVSTGVLTAALFEAPDKPVRFLRAAGRG
jgi:serine/threonine protein phosphatase 1